MSGWTVPGYTESGLLGSGASGRVVAAVHDATGTPVAVKYLNPKFRTDPEFVDRFREEAVLLADLTSPYVVQFYEYIETDTEAALVMELVDGVTLRTLLRESGPITPEAALSVMRGSLLGLAAAHEIGIVHRDYKPANVLIDTAGESKLADFGIADRYGTKMRAAGTPSYMAPEQWEGAPALPVTDIYAVTVTLFECLTGRVPYSAETLFELETMHRSAPIPLGEVPVEVQPLVAIGLAKELQNRPGNAAEFVAELELIAGEVYGPDWEHRGRRALAVTVGTLAALLPLALLEAALASAAGVGVAGAGAAAASSGAAAATSGSAVGSAVAGGAATAGGAGAGGSAAAAAGSGAAGAAAGAGGGVAGAAGAGGGAAAGAGGGAAGGGAAGAGGAGAGAAGGGAAGGGAAGGAGAGGAAGGGAGGVGGGGGLIGDVPTPPSGAGGPGFGGSGPGGPGGSGGAGGSGGSGSGAGGSGGSGAGGSGGSGAESGGSGAGGSGGSGAGGSGGSGAGAGGAGAGGSGGVGLGPILVGGVAAGGILGEIIAGEHHPPLNIDPLGATFIDLPEVVNHHHRRRSARTKAGIAATLVALLAVIGGAVAIGSHSSGPKDHQSPLADSTTSLAGGSTTSGDTPTPTPSDSTPTPTPTPTPTSTSSSSTQPTTPSQRSTSSTRPTTSKPSTLPTTPPTTPHTSPTTPTAPTSTPPPYTIQAVVTAVQGTYDAVCPPPSAPVTLQVTFVVTGTLTSQVIVEYNWYTVGRKDSDPSAQRIVISGPGRHLVRTLHPETYWMKGTITDSVGVTINPNGLAADSVLSPVTAPISITCTGVIQ